MENSLQPKTKKRKRWPWIIGGLLFFFILIGSCGNNSTNNQSQQKPEEQPAIENTTDTTNTTTQETAPKQENQPVVSEDEGVPNYSVVYTIKNHRYDGGVNYYVLIDTVDLSQPFKDKIKAIITDMVKKNGGKISVEIHDSSDSLEISYKQYGSMTLGRNRTAEEDAIQARHFIAAYMGELATQPEYNLMFFLGASSSDQEVGEFVGAETFKP